MVARTLRRRTLSVTSEQDREKETGVGATLDQVLTKGTANPVYDSRTYRKGRREVLILPHEMVEIVRTGIEGNLPILRDVSANGAFVSALLRKG